MTADEQVRLAAYIRSECERAARLAWEDAGVRGLCADGRVEAAFSAIREFDVNSILHSFATIDQH